MIIRIFSSFCSSENCKEVYERLCEVHKMPNYGPDKSFYITTGDDYTHVIILNTAMPTIKPGIPKSNVIGFAHEPLAFLGLTPQFIEYARKYIHTYYIGEKGNLPEPFVEQHGYMWHITPLRTLPSTKHNLMSIMISEKGFAPGHRYRHALVQHILRTNLPIDIYGRGCRYYDISDSRLKGDFTEKEPYESYQFHICIENFQTPRYFSEKIINTLLCGTTPIYLGAKHIDDYFPHMVYGLTGNVQEDMHFLTEVVENPNAFRKSIDVSDVKCKINLFENIRDIFT